MAKIEILGLDTTLSPEEEEGANLTAAVQAFARAGGLESTVISVKDPSTGEEIYHETGSHRLIILRDLTVRAA